MLISHRDDLTILGRDHEQVRNALDERSTLGHSRPGAILCQREDRDGLTGRRERVYPLVAVLKRQVDLGMPGDAAPSGEVQPDRPVGVAGTRRAVRAVRYPVRASAPVAPVVGVAVPRMIRRQLLGPRPAVFLVGLRLLPPPELREVQRLIFLYEPPLHFWRPLAEALGEVGGVHGSLPGSGQVAGFPSRTRSASSPCGPNASDHGP